MSEEMSTNTKGTLQLVAEHLAVAVQPLKSAVSDVDSFRSFMYRLGWNVTSLPPSYSNLAVLVDDIAIRLESFPQSPNIDQIIQLLEQIRQLYLAIKNLNEAPAGVDDTTFLSEIGERLFELLLIDYISSTLPALYNALLMLGVIEMEYHESTPIRPTFIRSRIRTDKISTIISDPLSIPKLVYGWGTNNFNFSLFADHLLEFLAGLGIPASIQQVRRGVSDAYQGESEQTSKAIETMVKIPFFETEIAETPIEVGIVVLELPGQDTKPPGIIIQPMIPQEVGNEYEISDELIFRVQAGTDLASTFGILLRSNEISVRYPFQPDRPPPAPGVNIALDYKPASPTTTKILLGSPTSTRLQISGATLGFSGQFGEGPELRAELDLKDLAVVISAGDQDSFLSKLLNGGDLIIPFPLVILWSSKTGFHFEGSPGLSVSFNPHFKIGGAKIDKLTLQLLTGDRVDPDPNFATEIMVAISGSIGPVSFSMDGIGLQLKIVFKDGNAGPFQIGVDMIPPHGLGLAINANGVRGGGFISRTENQYSGVIDLDLRAYSIQAFVILKTDPSVSLLFAIFSQFRTPIQLGAGWKITKIGGLIGIDRTVSHSDIASGIKSGILDSILFPDNVIENAPRIISDLERVFPANSGQNLIGPAVRIAYGTPTLITGDIALILEFPSPFQLSIIGKIRARIPNEEHPIVQINLAVLGAIDFTNERLGIYGALYDSKILDFTLSGDMAMAQVGAHMKRISSLALADLIPNLIHHQIFRHLTHRL